jgi:flagellar export protein FliJ
MKKYAFRLARVQRVRQVEQELAEARLAMALKSLTEAEAALEAERLRFMGIAPEPVDAGVEAYLIDQARQDRAAARVVEAAASRRAAEIEADAMRDAWQAAARAVTALERLDERRRAEYGAEVLRDEQAVLDEVANRRRPA